MTELKALGLVEMNSNGYDNSEKKIELKQEFNWFLSDEFLKLGYSTDGLPQQLLKEKLPLGSNNFQGLKEKSPPHYHRKTRGLAERKNPP